MSLLPAFPFCFAASFRLLAAAALALPGGLGLLSSRAQAAEPAAPHLKGRDVFRVYWTAMRASDNAPLLSASSLAVVGRDSEARTEAPAPEENKPALVSVNATISRTNQPGVFHLLTFVRVREVYRTKKGKQKISKRNIRALVPTRIGETQIVSSGSDFIRLEAKIEPSESRP